MHEFQLGYCERLPWLESIACPPAMRVSHSTREKFDHLHLVLRVVGHRLLDMT